MKGAVVVVWVALIVTMLVVEWRFMMPIPPHPEVARFWAEHYRQRRMPKFPATIGEMDYSAADGNLQQDSSSAESRGLSPIICDDL